MLMLRTKFNTSPASIPRMLGSPPTVAPWRIWEIMGAFRTPTRLKPCGGGGRLNPEPPPVRFLNPLNIKNPFPTTSRMRARTDRVPAGSGEWVLDVQRVQEPIPHYQQDEGQNRQGPCR